MGKIYVIGIGPGDEKDMSLRARQSLEEADTVIGYKTYTDLIGDLTGGKTVIDSPMRGEKQRCLKALDLHDEGKTVALISSGDSGIYGMAGVLLETIEEERREADVEIVPGITSVSAAAAKLGAPLMNDFCLVSLSDLMTDRDLIMRRIHAAVAGDFVLALYNPKSKKRTELIKEVRDYLLEHLPKTTPVAVVKNISRENEKIMVTDLEDFDTDVVDMTSLVIVGNSSSRYGKYFITPRGYFK